MEKKKFKRILVKVSGEALAGPIGFGIEPTVLSYMAQEIKKTYDLGVQICVVVGGGNFYRGSILSDDGVLDRTVADQMGMLGTIMNALALQKALERVGVETRVQSAISVSQVAENFILRRAIRHLEKNRVVLFAAGTGNPYFTTDTAAVLRALEIRADCLFKATKVDGVYDKDPMKHSDAVKYDKISFQTAIDKRLAVMDQTAFTMCLEHSLPIIVLNLNKENQLSSAVQGEPVGTYVADMSEGEKI